MFDPQPGQRLVIRCSLSAEGVPGTPRTGAETGAAGDAVNAPGTTDALGTVLAVSETHIALDTGRGRMNIPRATIVLMHEIPPAPTRPGRPHEIVSAGDLQRIEAAVWLPADSVWLNADNLRSEVNDSTPEVQAGWLLRAASGKAGRRSNSALVLGDPGIELEQAMEAVGAWYRERGLAPQFQIHSDTQGALAEASAQLGALFRRHGFTPTGATLALTAESSAVAKGTAVPDGLTIVQSDDAYAPHFAAWGHSTEAVGDEGHEAFAALLRSPEQFTILSAVAVHPDGSKTLVGALRLAFSMKWGMVSNLVVDENLRRRGAARALVQAAARLAAAQGVRALVAEVEQSNSASQALFTHLGFTEHHRYWFAVPSDAAPGDTAPSDPRTT